MAAIPTTERIKMLQEVRKLHDDGVKPDDIATELGMDVRTVYNNLRYLKDLSTADLSLEEVGKKREEIYLELLEATEEAKQLFHEYKESGGSLDTKRFFGAWLEALSMRAKLFGLDNMKIDSLIQINQQFNSINNDVSDTIDFATGEKLAKMIIGSHENRANK